MPYGPLDGNIRQVYSAENLGARDRPYPSTIPGVRGNVTRSHQFLEAESHFLLPFPFSYIELAVLAQDCRDPEMSGQRGIFTSQLMLESPVSGGEVGNEACGEENILAHSQPGIYKLELWTSVPWCLHGTEKCPSEYSSLASRSLRKYKCGLV